MRLFLRRFPILGGLQLFALLCAAMASLRYATARQASPKYFRSDPTTTLVVTTTADSGPGSLRAALAAANDGDTIQFDPALNGQTITLTSGELTVDKNLTITGPGPDQLAVSGSLASRIFHIMSGHTVVIEGLTITNGRSAAQSDGGGILNEGTLSLGNSTVSSNYAGHGGIPPLGYAGGIYVDGGSLELVQSTVSNNTAVSYGGGIQ